MNPEWSTLAGFVCAIGFTGWAICSLAGLTDKFLTRFHSLHNTGDEQADGDSSDGVAP